MDIHQKQWKESVSHLFATQHREGCPINTQGGRLLSIVSRTWKGSYWCQVSGQRNWKVIAISSYWRVCSKISDTMSWLWSLRGLWYQAVPFCFQNQCNSVLFPIFWSPALLLSSFLIINLIFVWICVKY